jgi:hypothetical protein
MTGGLIQLVSQGVEDIALTKDPQITFFKAVYRRHTNFSMEAIPQHFKSPLNFGKKASCTISRSGDLVSQIYLVLTLPGLSSIDEHTKFAWVRKIGFAIVKDIEIIINGELIDRQYGEWLNIWAELVGPKEDGFDKMIGNVPDLIQFSEQKDEYTIYVPLQFWFCKNAGSALPLVSLQYSEVKINIELNDIDKCLLVNPTHYIHVTNDFVDLKQAEYIEQTVNGKVAAGIFSHYDFISKKLYYSKSSNNHFVFENDKDNEYNGIRNIKHFIKGDSSGNYVVANSAPYLCDVPDIDISLASAFLLVDYVYLDQDERARFLAAKHDYLVEQTTFLGNSIIENSNVTVDVKIEHPCKFIVWAVKENHPHDPFNYTDNHKYKCGRSLVRKETILLNGKERVSFREYNYFNYIQPYQHFNFGPPEGINVYSFSLLPDKLQPSGSCNMSMIDSVQIKLNLNPKISASCPAVFTGYACSYNILRIAHGISGIIFV